jgi:hypothetical protein
MLILSPGVGVGQAPLVKSADSVTHVLAYRQPLLKSNDIVQTADAEVISYYII